MKRKTNFKKILFILGVLAAICLVLFLIVDQYVQKIGSKYIVAPDKTPPAEAILVLGAQVFPDGSVSDILKDRLIETAELYKNGKAPKILVSGDHGHQSYDETNTMKNYLKKLNIPSSDIFMDHAGFNTYNSIYRARDIFQIKKVIIVTQRYHLKRALFIAKELGLNIYGVASDKQKYPLMIIFKIREIAARFKAFIMAKVIKPQPTFLGKVIPITGDGKATDDK